jgi:cytochrome c556
MLRKFGVAAVLVAAAAVSATVVIAADEKKEEKTPTIKDCMKFQGRNGLATKVETAAKDGKWDDAAKVSAELAKLGEAIGKNTPPQNAEKKDDWEKQAKGFAERTKAVDDAVKAKKADDVSTTVKALLDNKTCGGCHGTFKPKK